MNSNSFLRCSAATVNKIGCLEKIQNVTELDMYNAIENWVNFEASEDQKHENFEAIQPAFKNIRFLAIETVDICKLNLLSAEERLKIVQAKLSNSESNSFLPEGFTKIKTPRWKKLEKTTATLQNTDYAAMLQTLELQKRELRLMNLSYTPKKSYKWLKM